MEPRPDDAVRLERVLGHAVDVALPAPPDGDAVVAVSTIGSPPRVRAAWVRPDDTVPARLGCPPGVPSAARPVTATLCDVAAEGASDHLVLGRVAPGVASVRATLAGPDPLLLPVYQGGLLAGRVPRSPVLIALDALAPDGESVGRLMRTGVHEMAIVAGRVEGRLGARHGMAAGFGAGDTVPGLPDAEREAGYTALLPTWLPAGFGMTTVRVEPEAAYPFAPPSIAIAWAPTGGDARVLLRQGPAPLAVPEQADARGEEVPVGNATGVLRARGMAFLVWEQGDRAFGLQVRGTGDPCADALAVARSVPAPPATGGIMAQPPEMT
jgi:hypothetical protein